MPRLTNPSIPINRAVDSGISRLIGEPTPITEDQPLSSAERIAVLLRRAKAIIDPPINPLQRDFWYFLTTEVKTKDESRAGVVRLIPSNYEYLKELIDVFIECPLALVAKSRRVLASWVACAFDVWIAAGGQDPRWLTLMNSTANRQVIIASRKLKDLQGSAWFLRNRVRFIVEELERNNIRDRWPEFPMWEWVETEGRASNGGLITAIASGESQARGAGATFVHCEELAFWENAKEAIESMIPTTLGGGHICCITTPQSRSYAHQIFTGTLKNPSALYQHEALYETVFDDDEDE